MRTFMKNILLSTLLFLAPFVMAEEAAVEAATPSDLVVNKADSLDQLLGNVQARRVVESREHSEREKRFSREKASQAKMLSDAESERAREERRSDRLETTFEENEIRIGDLTEALDKRLGSLRELFGVLQQVAGDTRGLFEASLISSQIPDRGDWLGQLAKKMGTASELATINEMEELWFELQREMTESGKMVKFQGTITKLSGDKVNTEIVRLGSYALIGEGEYLQWDPDTQAIIELPRQPSGRHVDTAEAVQAAAPGEIVEFSIDPLRGSLLALLIQAATVGEQVGSFGAIAECYLPFCDGQGGMMGAIIILGGVIGLLLAFERLLTLFMVGAKVNAQRKNPTASDDNPLGRVLKVFEENKDVDVETLELKLGEAILGETPKLTRNITLIQVISVVAPLAGLLGTVIGMIETFQAITLFGAGDPKTMASGISKALMTTVLGLCVAIPMTLLHALVNAKSKSVIHIIEEQSAGIIAEHAEKSGQPLG
ncbi:MAG: MotA/TolQ/ExbB proton channel family protein [Gammaproteobacteria bacterium]|nr:MotA/TolQ/ExbB proton channel family protein [Gammaproteobacteria bacterium]